MSAPQPTYLTESERGQLIGWCVQCGRPADHRHDPAILELFAHWPAAIGAPTLPPSVPVDTSEAAAEQIRPSAPSLREAIFALIRDAGDRGMTAGELEALGYAGSTIRPRLRELQGDASWAKGQLPARIVKTPAQRGGMRVYVAL